MISKRNLSIASTCLIPLDSTAAINQYYFPKQDGSSLSPGWGAGMARWWESRVCCWFSPCSESFRRVSRVSSSTKTNIFKFQFNQDRGPAWKPAKADVASSLNIAIIQNDAHGFATYLDPSWNAIEFSGRVALKRTVAGGHYDKWCFMERQCKQYCLFGQ